MKRFIASAVLACSTLLTTTAAHAWWWDYTQTKYPIVLAHGMAGFANVGPIDYWYGIPQDLRSGGAKVYVTTMSSFASSDVRGEQLLKQVQDILAISGAQKVNLIGHSHGAQSIRYVAGVIPSKVASATTVGGPNQGSLAATGLWAVLNLPVGQSTVTGPFTAAANAFGWLIGISQFQNLPQDTLAGIQSLTVDGATRFTQRFPAGVPTTACGEGDYSANGVRFYSWSGTGTFTNPLDISDPFLALTSILIGESNDGLVGHCSSHFGKVIRDNYNMNHLDEINHLFGLTNLFETDPKAVYRAQANRLKSAGL